MPIALRMFPPAALWFNSLAVSPTAGGMRIESAGCQTFPVKVRGWDRGEQLRSGFGLEQDFPFRRFEHQVVSTALAGSGASGASSKPGSPKVMLRGRADTHTLTDLLKHLLNKSNANGCPGKLARNFAMQFPEHGMSI